MLHKLGLSHLVNQTFVDGDSDYHISPEDHLRSLLAQQDGVMNGGMYAPFSPFNVDNSVLVDSGRSMLRAPYAPVYRSSPSHHVATPPGGGRAHHMDARAQKPINDMDSSAHAHVMMPSRYSTMARDYAGCDTGEQDPIHDLNGTLASLDLDHGAWRMHENVHAD